MSEKKLDSAQKMVEAFLKENKDDHYNFCQGIDYKISTGSLKFDWALGGGLGPGVHRLGGASEGGKTSCALEVMRNFLETVPNSRAIIFKAEGRLSEKMMKRSQIKFAKDATEWVPGTAFIYKTNIYDSIANLIESLIKNNDEDFKYIFLIDSMDGLILREDQGKKIGDGDHVKVAGPQVLSKLLLKRTSLPITELGHMLLMISQVIGKIENKYEKKEQLNVSGSGGNAIIHFSNFILYFNPRYQGDFILDGSKIEKDFDKSNILGHNCKVTIQKSDNETTGQNISYPIRYSKTGADGIWHEYELEYFLTAHRLIEKKSSWISLSENLRKRIKENTSIKEVPEKLQGSANLIKFLAQDEVKKYLYKYFRDWMNSDDIL